MGGAPLAPISIHFTPLFFFLKNMSSTQRTTEEDNRTHVLLQDYSNTKIRSITLDEKRLRKIWEIQNKCDDHSNLESFKSLATCIGPNMLVKHVS